VAGIAAPPGSGPVRGVHIFDDDVYAFRDTVLGTNCKMYKATVSGWDEVVLDSFRLRVNGTNKRIYGTIQSGQKLTVSVNFGIWKTKESCLELIRGDIVYTTLCHDPTIAIISGTGTTQDINYNALQFRLEHPDV
jgi:hypothetical protein